MVFVVKNNLMKMYGMLWYFRKGIIIVFLIVLNFGLYNLYHESMTEVKDLKQSQIELNTQYNSEKTTLSEQIEKIEGELSATRNTLISTQNAVIEDFNSLRVVDCKITAYCTCEKCCGKSPDNPAYGITYSGTHVEEGRTIAVDPKVIPIGSIVYIEGIGVRVAEDTGNPKYMSGNRVDLFIDDHDKAWDFGVKHAKVLVLVEGGSVDRK